MSVEAINETYTRRTRRAPGALDTPARWPRSPCDYLAAQVLLASCLWGTGLLPAFRKREEGGA